MVTSAICARNTVARVRVCTAWMRSARELQLWKAAGRAQLLVAWRGSAPITADRASTLPRIRTRIILDNPL